MPPNASCFLWLHPRPGETAGAVRGGGKWGKENVGLQDRGRATHGQSPPQPGPAPRLCLPGPPQPGPTTCYCWSTGTS